MLLMLTCSLNWQKSCMLRDCIYFNKSNPFSIVVSCFLGYTIRTSVFNKLLAFLLQIDKILQLLNQQNLFSPWLVSAPLLLYVIDILLCQETYEIIRLERWVYMISKIYWKGNWSSLYRKETHSLLILDAYETEIYQFSLLLLHYVYPLPQSSNLSQEGPVLSQNFGQSCSFN